MVSAKSVAGSTGSKSTVIRLLLIVVAGITLFSLVAYYNSRPGKQAARRPPGNEGFNALSTASAQLPPMPMPMPVPVHSAPMAAPPPTSAILAAPVPRAPASASASASPMGIEPFGNDRFRAVGSDPAVGNSILEAFPQDRLTPEDLLPKDAANSKWAQMNPAGQGDVKDQNYLTAGYHVGYDTQGSSLRNASWDIRSTPPNPRYNVSIWSQSTIEPDMNRRPLE